MFPNKAITLSNLQQQQKNSDTKSNWHKLAMENIFFTRLFIIDRTNFKFANGIILFLK